MAISVVATVEAGNTNGLDVTLPLTGTAANDVVVVIGGNGNHGSAASILTSGYTVVDIRFHSNTSFVVAYKRLSAPETEVIGNGSGDNQDAAAYVAIVLRGVNTTTALDAVTTFNESNGDPNSPPITTVTDGALVISAFIAEGDDDTISAPSGYSNKTSHGTSDTFSVTAGLATKVVAFAASENPSSWGTSLGSGSDYIATTIAIRPAAAGTFGDGSLSSTGTGAANFVGTSGTLGSAIFSATGSGDTSFIGSPFVSSPASLTGTASVSWEGGSLANIPVPFSMVGTGTAIFVGAIANAGTLSATGTIRPEFTSISFSDVEASMTGRGQAQFVGGVSHLSSVREDIRSRGAATITMGHNVG